MHPLFPAPDPAEFCENQSSVIVRLTAQMSERTVSQNLSKPLRNGDSRLFNRELSWLDFNERVLDLAADPATPLLERVRYCAIYSSNLDEFFMIRVGGLERQIAFGLDIVSADGRSPRETLAGIRERVSELGERQLKLWESEIVPALAAEGISVASTGELSEDERIQLREAYEREVYPIVTPLAVGPGQPFPYISGLSLSLGVYVRDSDTGEERFARVKVPEGIPRFLRVGEQVRLVPLEAVMAEFLPTLFPGMDIVERAAFRVTRDADFEVSDEADDLLEAVDDALRRRRFGDVIRVEVSAGMSPQMLNRIRDGVGARDEEVYEVDGLLDLADVSQIANLDVPRLKFAAWAPKTSPRFARAGSPKDLFSEIRKADILVHMPYESFSTSVASFVRAAAEDPDVLAMKTTVYRTSDESPVVPALIEAAEDGKQTVCLVELKARFDEMRNIEWSRRMEQAGVHVVYGFLTMKIHGKTTLVVRREGGKLRRYVHVGTGNYNSATARLYEDFGLFTADEDLVADVADLFNYLTGFAKPERFRKILVAPFNLRKRLVEEIERVADAARAGKPAQIQIKANSINDVGIIEALYDASCAGAQIEICVRGICALRPGVPGMSENVNVRSILGRFLEHARLYRFVAGDEVRCFMGSADLMPRNLDSRIEVIVPVEDAIVRKQLGQILETAFADNTFAWSLGADGVWSRLAPGEGQKPVSFQETLMRRAAKRSAERRTRKALKLK